MIVENAGWGAGSAAPIARRAFDYMLLGQYPSEEDMAAVQKGVAVAPVGTPRRAADMAGWQSRAGALATPADSPAPQPVPAGIAAKGVSPAAVVATSKPAKSAGPASASASRVQR